jgi:hypothetical protein
MAAAVSFDYIFSEFFHSLSLSIPLNSTARDCCADVSSINRLFTRAAPFFFIA